MLKLNSGFGDEAMIFQNRVEAGKRLASDLVSYKSEHPVIVALPRGGVPVGIQVAKALDASLEILCVKKVGAPLHSEFGIAAVTEDGTYVLNQSGLSYLGLVEADIEQSIRKKAQEARMKGAVYRSGRRIANLNGKVVIVVDDGLATGVTAFTAAKYLKKQGARKTILAIPVGAYDSIDEAKRHFDVVICVSKEMGFQSVGEFYEEFDQVSDEETVSLVRDFEKTGLLRPDEMSIPAGSVFLKGVYQIPKHAKSTILFAHGVGSGRLSPRNRMIAAKLFEVGFATLMVDLLTEEEGNNRQNVFDIALLSSRVVELSKWVIRRYNYSHRIGYFGASTGVAAALEASIDFPNIFAIAARGGRPDLAPRINRVTAPTLLIVGSEDRLVIDLNRNAAAQLKNGKLEIIPGATRLFEEPGALEMVMELSKKWFLKNLERSLLSNAVQASIR